MVGGIRGWMRPRVERDRGATWKCPTHRQARCRPPAGAPRMRPTSDPSPRPRSAQPTFVLGCAETRRPGPGRDRQQHVRWLRRVGSEPTSEGRRRPHPGRTRLSWRCRTPSAGFPRRFGARDAIRSGSSCGLYRVFGYLARERRRECQLGDEIGIARGQLRGQRRTNPLLEEHVD